MIISFVYVAYIGMSDGIWVIMTCAIILFDNPTLGGTINKSHLRFWELFAAGFSLIFIIGFANNVIINLFVELLSVLFSPLTGIWIQPKDILVDLFRGRYR